MCIIVAKPAGVPAPDLSTLQRCYEANPDGAGLMLADGEAVQIRKGFMSWEAFAGAYTALGDTEAVTLVMHFRIATHGGVRPSCCHPFPLSADVNDLRELEASAAIGIAHNGVIAGMDTTEDVSDTMAYILDVLAPLQRWSGDIMGDADARRIVDLTIGSKLALIDGAGSLELVGDFEECGGVYYSNASYRRQPFSWPKTWPLAYADEDGAPFGEDADPWDELEDDGDLLPFDACDDCVWCDDCAYGVPYCDTLADVARNYQNAWYGEEVTA